MKSLALAPIVLVLTLLLAVGSVLAHPPASASGAQCTFTFKRAPVPQVGDLTDILSLSPNNVWVASATDFLHWDGIQWNIVDNPSTARITGISGVSSDQLWAVGNSYEGGRSYVMLRWNGVAWESVADAPALEGIHVLNQNDIWGYGDRSIWHWNGSLWESLEAPGSVSDLAVLSPTNIWASGLIIENVVSTAYTWHWNGSTWDMTHSFGTSPASFMASIYANNENDIWAVGSQAAESLIAHWDGHDWTLAEYTGSGFLDVSGRATDDIYAVGENIAHWNGIDWAYGYEGAPHRNQLLGVAILSQDAVWAVGYKYFDSSTHKSLLIKGTRPCVPPTPTPVPTAVPCYPFPAPIPLSPEQDAQLSSGIVPLQWSKSPCAIYRSKSQVVIKLDTKRGQIVLDARIKKHKLTTPPLAHGHTYTWHVRTCLDDDCGAWSKWRRFTIQQP